MGRLNDFAAELDAEWWRWKERQEVEPEYHPWLVDCGYEEDIEEE